MYILLTGQRAQDNSIREWYGVGSMRIYPDARVWRSVRRAAASTGQDVKHLDP